MTTGTVRELTLEIENNLRELQEFKRDLKELYQDLKTEIERAEREEDIARYGKTVYWEEIEWDIYCTESAIERLTIRSKSLRDRLEGLLSKRSSRRVATE